MDIKKKLLVIDGSAVLHRAYHALPPFTSPDGTPTNALYGFIKMLLSLIDQVQPMYLVVCFDSPIPTFRKKLLPSYQAQRPKTPDEYKVQIPLTQKYLEKAGIAQYFLPGFEADDVIGTITALSKREDPDLHVYIVTGDKDILQLVDERTTVLMPKSGVGNINYMREQQVKERLGVMPKQIIDYKALVGDPSDNYGGIRGIGPKKATDLLMKYGNLKNIYEHIEELDHKVKSLLVECKKDAELSQTLATIKTDLDLPIHNSDLDFKTRTPSPELIEYLDSLSLQSIKRQLQQIKAREEKMPVSVKKKDNQLTFF
ncbi:MAG: 5'-3' exonuclease H3TH domain-containing protein [Patescibacteria group bacterium]|jgi:DNA polymerase-1